MTRSIYIYDDAGVGDESRISTFDFFKEYEPQNVKAEDIISNTLNQNDIFIMPGGADLPYCKKLNGAGNLALLGFIEKGGTYVGICAGAYYASKQIAFQKGMPTEICQPRELALLNGLAYGCLSDIAAPYDTTINSAEITTITCDEESLSSVYWGGPAFKFDEQQDVIVHGRYQDVQHTPPALISFNHGCGKVVLSGVHFEISPENLLNSANKNERQKREKLSADLEQNYSRTKTFMKDILGL